MDVHSLCNFVAYDSDGKQYRIHCYATFQEDADVNGMFAPQSPPWFETSDGQKVAITGERRFRLIDLGVDLSLDKPNTD